MNLQWGSCFQPCWYVHIVFFYVLWHRSWTKWSDNIMAEYFWFYSAIHQGQSSKKMKFHSLVFLCRKCRNNSRPLLDLKLNIVEAKPAILLEQLVFKLVQLTLCLPAILCCVRTSMSELVRCRNLPLCSVQWTSLKAGR